MRTVRHLLTRFRNAVSNSVRPFSSSAAVIRQPWTHCTDESEDSDGKSALYKRALKLQRPTTIRYKEYLHNSVSLIGTIELPLRACKYPEFGLHTELRVNPSSTGAYGGLWVKLTFWGEMAEISAQHLKPNDLVYVSGYLRSYTRVDESGKSMPIYKVDVKEVNYVAQVQPRLGSAGQNLVKFEPEVSVEDIMQKRRNRLHLWHIFFASPSEWWDNRNCKTNPRAPDFKHKDTGEVLWLRDTDPPWVRKQLQLQDSRLSKGEHRSHLSHLSL